MSIDALLWICTLLFAAAMLILSAMRHAEAVEAAADEPDPDEDETRTAYRPASGRLDLGGGWTIGGAGGED